MKAGGYPKSRARAARAGAQASGVTGSFGVSLLPLMVRGRRPLGRCHVGPWSTRADTRAVHVEGLTPQIWFTNGLRWMGRYV
jgi:hypothetical protein